MTSAFTRSRGDNVPAITRHTPSSKTSSREAYPQRADAHSGFGAQLQPNEQEAGNTVEDKGQGTSARAQAGAHAGPVGSAEGPGHPGVAEERELAADMPRKRAEHSRVFGEQSSDGSGAERALGKQRSMEQETEIKSNHGGRKASHA